MLSFAEIHEAMAELSRIYFVQLEARTAIIVDVSTKQIEVCVEQLLSVTLQPLPEGVCRNCDDQIEFKSAIFVAIGRNKQHPFIGRLFF